MKCIERPLTKKQREQLQGYVALSTHALRALLFVAFVAGAGLVLRGLQRTIVLTGAPWWLVPTGAIAVALFTYSKRWSGGREFRRKVREDLKSGKARITIVEPTSVVKMAEEEDEGPSYIVETTDGETILFTGQYLTHARRFPWSKIEIIEAPHSGEFFGIKRSGDTIPVDEARSPMAYDVAKRLDCFNHNYIVLDEEAKALIASRAAPPPQ